MRARLARWWATPDTPAFVSAWLAAATVLGALWDWPLVVLLGLFIGSSAATQHLTGRLIAAHRMAAELAGPCPATQRSIGPSDHLHTCTSVAGHTNPTVHRCPCGTAFERIQIVEGNPGPRITE